MGSLSSKSEPTSAPPRPLHSTTTSAPAPASTTTSAPAPVPTIGAEHGFDDHEVLYMLLSFLAGALLASLIFTFICLIIGQRTKKSRRRFQEASPEKGVAQSMQQADVEHAQEKLPQDEVHYASLTFKKTSKSAAEK